MTDWAKLFRAAEAKSEAARIDRDIALRNRCHELDSGGAQCTADRQPAHEHRYLVEDLPGYDPTEF